MTSIFSHSILFKRWVGGFRVFYNAMFEICPPSQNPFLYVPSNVMVSFSCMQVCLSPLFHPSGRRMAVQLHFSSEKRCCSFRYQLCILSVVTFSMCSFLLCFYLCDVYVTNAFRTSVYGTFICELPTMGSCAVSSLLPFMALLLTLMVLFYVKGNKLQNLIHVTNIS